MNRDDAENQREDRIRDNETENMEEILNRVRDVGIEIKPSAVKSVARKLGASLATFYGKEAIIEYIIKYKNLFTV